MPFFPYFPSSDSLCVFCHSPGNLKVCQSKGFNLTCNTHISYPLAAWSTGVCMYMIWAGVACLNQFINSIVWNGNAIDFAPVWCDICESFSSTVSDIHVKVDAYSAAKLLIGTAVAIPAASLAINRRLYHISSGFISNSVIFSKSKRRHDVLSDLCICLGLPLLEMILRTSRFLLSLCFF